MNYDIWPYDQGLYKVFLQDEQIKDEILSWEECHLHCYYYNPKEGKGWDIIFPAKHHKRVQKYLKECKIPK